MFTGIIEVLGEVVSLEHGVLHIQPLGDMGSDEVKLGESIAIDGCCLTVVEKEPFLTFDLSPETIERTAFLDLKSKDIVHLERAMRADGRFGGHIVQGHVDTVATFIDATRDENSVVMRFQVPIEDAKYLIDKGSITVAGISLTVVRPEGGIFEVWVIPHTLEVTKLGSFSPGQKVNVEFDVLAKYIEKLIPASLSNTRV